LSAFIVALYSERMPLQQLIKGHGQHFRKWPFKDKGDISNKLLC